MYHSTFRCAPIDYRHEPVRLSSEVIHVCLPNNLNGASLRLCFSNRYGEKSLLLRQVQVGDVPVKFDGAYAVLIPAGREIVSDDLNYPARAGESLYISYSCDCHRFTTGLRKDHARQIELPFLKAVAVNTRQPVVKLACFGDSITQHSQWFAPLRDTLYRRYPGEIVLYNYGIGGNRVMHDSVQTREIGGHFGKAMIQRMLGDVLEEDTPNLVLIHGGVNDLFQAVDYELPWQNITAGLLEGGLCSLVDMAHGAGAKAALGTIMPFRNWHCWNEEMEEKRQSVNKWIRQSTEVDYLLDYDAYLRDEEKPSALAAAYDSGDGLHPNEAGGDAMSELILNKIDFEQLFKRVL